MATKKFETDDIPAILLAVEPEVLQNTLIRLPELVQRLEAEQPQTVAAELLNRALSISES